MKISMILAWCAVLCVILTAVRYLVRVSKNPNWNRVFHKLHIPMGLLALLLQYYGLSGYSPISPNETERIAQIERIRRMKQQADNHGE